MNNTQLINLILHVMFGLLGVTYSYAYLTNLHKKILEISRLKRASILAFLFYLISWISGGYYYLTYYGGQVRGVIKSGSFAWAHGIFMEGKEHIFLFLPFITFITVLVTFLLGERINQNENLKKILILIAGITFAIGVLVTFSGIFISGAYRPKI